MVTHPDSRKGPVDRTPPIGRLTVTHTDRRWDPLIEFFLKLDPEKDQTYLTYQGLKFDFLLDDVVLNELLGIADSTEDAFLAE